MNFYQQLQHETREARSYLLASPQLALCLQGKLPLKAYRAFLTQAYHHVKHTVPLLMAAGARLSQENEWLRTAMAEYVHEEIGHQEWILNDIKECGGDPRIAASSEPHLATDVMVSYAYDLVNRKNPVAILGMIHVLEGTSIALAHQVAQTLGTSLGLPQEAFSYLVSHGALDQQHIQFLEKLVNRLDNERDRWDVLHAAKTMYVLYANILRSIEVQPAHQPVESGACA